MDKLIEQLHKENGNRWLGKAHYSCLTCSHSMSTDENQLVCVVNTKHKQVDDNHVCKKWN